MSQQALGRYSLVHCWTTEEGIRFGTAYMVYYIFSYTVLALLHNENYMVGESLLLSNELADKQIREAERINRQKQRYEYSSHNKNLIFNGS